MRYVNHKFGRACVHRPRREEGERRRTRERGHERVAKRYEENQRGIRRDRERGEEKKQVWVLKNAEERNVRVSRWWMSHAHGFSF